MKKLTQNPKRRRKSQMKMKKLLSQKLQGSKKALLYFGVAATAFYGLGHITFDILKEKYIIALDTTGSTTHKFFVVEKKESRDVELKNGEYVAFYFNHDNDPYYENGHNFIKKVACKEGETLSVIANDFFCNEKYLGIGKKRDSKNKPVELFKYDGKIPEGHYFVMGDSIHSYDSRYWGFVKKDQIIGKALW
ncbi:MAG: signal peptidase I [Sulfurimonadaceae bacterium]